jgi:hypothetical protein
VPTVSSATVVVTADNGFSLYVNDSVLTRTGDNWQSWFNFNVSLYVGVTNYISIYVHDSGGAYGMACYIKDSSNTVFLKTSTSWVSA